MAHTKVIDAIKKIAKSKGFTSFDIETPELFQKGEGFLSEQFSVVVRDRDNSDRELKLIIKQAFSSDAIRRIIGVKESFINEIFFYKTLYPAFKELHDDCDDIAPICYAHCDDDNCEFLILEDLREKQFRNLEKSEYINEDYIEFVLKRYGKFHAYCYAIKEKNPKLVEDLLSNVDMVKDFLGKEWTIFAIRDMVDTVKDSLDELADKEILDRFVDYKENAKDIITKSIENDVDDFMTFLHGDCWSNNLMFKINDENKLEDLRMIDFQFTRIGSPVCDLSYFLYSGASKKGLDNLDDLLKIYHDSLTEHASKLGCNNFIPFEELQRQWPKYSRFGFIMAIQVLKAKLQPPKDAKNLKDMEHLFENLEEGHQITEENYKSSDELFIYDKDEFNRRLIDIIRHMHEIKAF